jgi:hypothetical protein
MQKAVLKYISKPLVTELSIEPIKTIQKPLIYVCQENQFNYSRAHELGYSGQSSFLTGKLNGTDKPTWLGNSKNKSYIDIEQDLFNYNYTDFTVDNADNELFFIQSHGYCQQVLNFSMNSIQNIFSYHPIRIFILDPHRSTQLRIEQNLGQTSTLFAGNNRNEFIVYKLVYILQDDSIHDGLKCTDYRKIASSYDSCVQDNVLQKLHDWYGCVPIWFPYKNEKCSLSNNPLKNETVDYIFDLVNLLEIKTDCKPSCLRLEIKLQEVQKFSNYPSEAVIQLMHEKNFEVLKTVYAYDGFSLIVELGSALGLWLGLSVIGMLDIIIVCGLRFQQVFAIKTRNHRVYA